MRPLIFQGDGVCFFEGGCIVSVDRGIGMFVILVFSRNILSLRHCNSGIQYKCDKVEQYKFHYGQIE